MVEVFVIGELVFFRNQVWVVHHLVQLLFMVVELFSLLLEGFVSVNQLVRFESCASSTESLRSVCLKESDFLKCFELGVVPSSLLSSAAATCL